MNLPAVSKLIQKGLLVGRCGFAINNEIRTEYQIATNYEYRKILSEVNYLTKVGKIHNNIYVFSTPLYYYLAGKVCPIPYFATWFHPTPEVWMKMLTMLDRIKPGLIFVQDRKLESTKKNYPRMVIFVDEAISFIQKNYNLLYKTKDGAWYELKKQLS